MLLFFRKRKPSEESRKRLEHQLCLVFIVHDNQLTSLVPKSCSITSLVTLKTGAQMGHDDPGGIGSFSVCVAFMPGIYTLVLDLHENKLTSLPADLGQLCSLQVLNVERNQLQCLPESIGELSQLQTLSVRGNCLSELPTSLGRMRSLRTLDLSENKVRELPTELASVRTLETLTLDAAAMTFPPASVCAGGTEAIQQFLCADRHTCTLVHLDARCYKVAFYFLITVTDVRSVSHSMQNKFQDYEKRKEHQRLEAGLCHQRRVLEAERHRLMHQLKVAEESITGRIKSLLMQNQRQKKGAELLQTLEKESLGQMDRMFEQVLSLQQLDQSKALRHILQEEEMQKAAFEAMQLQKDGMHRYIRNQVEMQQKSEASQENYWMIQYQRLLDAKPQSLQVQEAGLQQGLVDLLAGLSAQHYLPILAHHRVSTETLRGLSAADLKQMGISEVGVQRALLSWAQEQGPTAPPGKLITSSSSSDLPVCHARSPPGPSPS
ncbi:UNVERIFIED_CONTAM: hypothetical protein FKN15_058126 [Acipenser sinensis]